MSNNKKTRLPRQTRKRRSRLKTWLVVGIVASFITATGALAWRANRVSPRPAPVQGGSLAASNPATEYIYVGGRLLATESAGSGGGGGAVSMPTNFEATAVSANQITVTWDASSGPVHHYEIERTNNISVPYSVIGEAPPSSEPSFTDSTVSPGVCYLYRVRAVDGGDVPSGPSIIDLATTIIFADQQLVAGSTVIKAVHVTELRQAVNAVRATGNLGAASWTDGALQGVVVKAVHIQELRNNLNPARAAIGVPAIQYQDPTLTVGVTPVKVPHVQQLRDGVK